MEVIMLLLLLFGALECFFGYRIFRIITALVGFIVGGAIGGVLGFFAAQQIGALIGGLVVGILGGFLAFKLYKLGVFVICFFAGAALGLVLGAAAGDQSMAFAFAGIAGLALGVLGVLLTGPLIIISTAIGGGMSCGMSLGTIMSNMGLGLLLGVVLSIAGILLQFYMEKKKDTSGEKMPAAKPASVRQPGNDSDAGLVNNMRGVFSRLKGGAATAAQRVSGGVQSATAAAQAIRRGGSSTLTRQSLPGWNTLVQGKAPQWRPGLPVAVTQVDIVTRTNQGETPQVSLALGLQNLEQQEILGVFFTAKCFNLLRQELPGLEKQAVQDLMVAPGGLWFSQTPFVLPDPNTRWVELVVENVVMKDGSIWSDDGSGALKALPEQEPLALDEELRAEFLRLGREKLGRDLRALWAYQPQKGEGCWRCACGQLCPEGTEKCLCCGVGHEELFDLAQPQRLAQLRTERLAEEEHLREERRQRVAEQTQAAKEKAAETAEAMKKGMGVAAGAAISGLEKGADWSRKAGDQLGGKAKELSEQGKDLWSDKVVPNRNKILLTAAVAATALVVFTGVFFGLKVYQNHLEGIQTEERLRGEELAAWEAQFLFPYSDKEPIPEEDLEALTQNELIMVRAEILARHGVHFSDENMSAYFQEKEWYTSSVSEFSFDVESLNTVEQDNLNRIDALLEKMNLARIGAAGLGALDRATMDTNGSACVSQFAGSQPINGCWLWFSGTQTPDDPDEDRALVAWNSSQGIQAGTLDSKTGTLLAMAVDFEKDGIPELVVAQCPYGQNLLSNEATLTFKVLAYNGSTYIQTGPLWETELMYSEGGGWLAETEISLVETSKGSWLRIHDYSGDMGDSEERDTFWSPALEEEVEVSIGTTLENEPLPPVYYYNGREVSRETYDQVLARYDGTETMLYDSYLVDVPDSVRSALDTAAGQYSGAMAATRRPGGFQVDVAEEYEAARSLFQTMTE